MTETLEKPVHKRTSGKKASPVASSRAELADRIAEIAQTVGGNSALARICNVSPSVIGKWATAASEPGASHLVSIARAGSVTVEWLATGDGAKRPGESVRADEYAFVPLYDVSAAAGQGAFVNGEASNEALAFRRDWLSRNIGVSPQSLSIINVSGDSMEPLLRGGDVIMVNRANTTVTEGIYVFFLDGFLFVKRLQLRADGIWAVSENQTAGPPFPLPRFEDFDERSGIVGRVVWAGRRL